MSQKVLKPLLEEFAPFVLTIAKFGAALNKAFKKHALDAAVALPRPASLTTASAASGLKQSLTRAASESTPRRLRRDKSGAKAIPLLTPTALVSTSSTVPSRRRHTAQDTQQIQHPSSFDSTASDSMPSTVSEVASAVSPPPAPSKGKRVRKAPTAGASASASPPPATKRVRASRAKKSPPVVLAPDSATEMDEDDHSFAALSMSA